MTNTTLNAPNRSINQILNTDDGAGNFIQKNKNALIGLFVFIVIAIVGAGLYSQYADEAKSSANSKIYAFLQGPFKKFAETGAEPAAALLAFKTLHADVKNYAGLFPVTIQLSDSFLAHKNLAEALEVLNIGDKISNNEYNNYFVLARMAVVFEDLGQSDKAIATLEKMNSAKLKIFEGKNYVDLGRIYLKLGNKDKAKSSFQYVVDKAHDEAEFVKIAKLYLSKI